MTNIEFAAALREMAEFYEKTPAAPQPYPFMYIHAYQRKEFIEAALAISKGGKIQKLADPADETCGRYRAIRTFGAGLQLEVSIDRKSVCRLISPAVYDCPDSLLEEAAEYTEIER